MSSKSEVKETATDAPMTARPRKSRRSTAEMHKIISKRYPKVLAELAK